MSSRLLSTGLLVVTLTIGFGLGRALAPDGGDAPPSTVDATDPDTSDRPLAPLTDRPTGPTLAELVPGLDQPIYMETANPTQLLRWDLDEPYPLPVRNIPAGHLLDMDRDARFVLVLIADGDAGLLLGGLAGTPLAVIGMGIDAVPTRTDFTDHFWFVQGEDLVQVNTRGEETDRLRLPELAIATDGVEPTLFGSPTVALADEAGLILEQWYAIGEGPPAVRRVLLQSSGVLDLPGGENSFAAGMTGDTVFIRTREGVLTTVDRSTGEAAEADYDGTCGLTLVSADGIVASVCRGLASVFLDQSINHVGTWTTGRWSASGDWFMAVAGYFGELLLVEAATSDTSVLRFPLTPQTLLVDVWSGA